MKKIHLKFGLIGLGLLLMSSTIDLADLFNYENQLIPNYINRDNTTTNPIDDATATLGRVLFYDKSLSANNTVSCASCHHQENGFGDLVVQSDGFNGGVTGRHAMRIINSRFSNEHRFFWDERAATLEEQTTMPIQDPVEMGYSGEDGDPNIDDLIAILETKDYYQTLFNYAFGDPEITEERMQLALAQFVRSIQSFDSKFDTGLAQVGNPNQPFPNFTDEENMGKMLFTSPPGGGPGGGGMGAGCAACHQPPEFNMNPNVMNNGVIGVAGDPNGMDLTNTKAPSLRNLVDPLGQPNGPFMHDGSMETLLEVVNHYDSIPNNPLNTNLDQRLRRPGNQTQQLNLTDDQKNAIVAFLETLSGVDVYTNEKWSDPFEPDGSIMVINGTVTSQNDLFEQEVNIYPNPVEDFVNINIEAGNYDVEVFNMGGKLLRQTTISGQDQINLSEVSEGLYILKIINNENNRTFTKKLFVK